MAGSDRAAARGEERRRAWIVVGLVQIAFLGVVGLEYGGFLPKLERLIYDTFLDRVQAPEAIEPRILVVEYTEADERRYGYPLPDRILARLLDELAAGQPVAIGLDLIRDRPEPATDQDGHQRLTAVMAAQDAIVGIVKDTEPGGFAAPPALADRPLQLGFPDVMADPDGVVRRGLLYLTTPAGTRPSLALQLAGRWLLSEGIEPAFQDDRIRLGEAAYARLRPTASSLYAGTRVDGGGYQFLLTFPVCPSADRISVGEALDGGLDDGALEGRLVLIGNTVRIYKDQFAIPVECEGPVPGEIFGVHLHAEIASQLILQAKGLAQPIETLAQRLGSPLLGQAAGIAWIWLWSVLGGTAAALAASPLLIAMAAAAGAIAILGAGLGAFLGAGLWLPMASPIVAAAGAAALVTVYLMTWARGERTELKRLFAATVSGRVAESIWRVRGTLTGSAKPPPKLMMASVLFSDIRGFSTVSTMMSEFRLAAWLDLYMEAMVDIVERHGGVIEKFAGDGLTVEFGVPEPRETDAEIAADARAAVDCALDMADALVALNRAMADRDLPEITIRVGIHSGPLVAGVIGGAKRWQFSIVGDTANTAARLESYGKDDPRLGCEADHCRILISETTYHLLDGRYAADAVGALEMRNRGPINVYRISGLRAIGMARSGGPQS